VSNLNTISPTLSIADSVLPRFDWNDDKKRAYLSFRLCGFGRQEACDRVKITRKTIYNWMSNDSAFHDVEQMNLMELRKEFSKNILSLEFTRNMRMILERDSNVLKHSR
jgi:hypothetical protein